MFHRALNTSCHCVDTFGFVVAFRVCFKNLCEQFSETLIGGNVDKGYDCMCDLFFSLKEE